MIHWPRWKYHEYAERYLANINDNKFHDLDNEDPRCQISEIIANRCDTAYKYKTDAKRDGYLPCPYCLPDEQEK